jgi:hypothetical protein
MRAAHMLAVTVLAGTLAVMSPSAHQEAPPDQGRRACLAEAAELRTTVSVLHTTAHPDDEQVLPSSSVAGIHSSFYEARYYRRICVQQF